MGVWDKNKLAPQLDDLIAEAQEIRNFLASAGPLSEKFGEIDATVAGIMEKLEAHKRAERALFDAAQEAHVAAAAAREGMVGAPPGTDGAFFKARQALSELGDKLDTRFDYEAKRYTTPG